MSRTAYARDSFSEGLPQLDAAIPPGYYGPLKKPENRLLARAVLKCFIGSARIHRAATVRERTSRGFSASSVSLHAREPRPGPAFEASRPMQESAAPTCAPPRSPDVR